MRELLFLFGGIVIALVILALFKFYQTMREIKNSLDAFTLEVRPLMANGLILQTAKSVQAIAHLGAEVTRNLAEVVQVLNVFNSAMLAKPENDRGPNGTGPIGTSAVFTYSEDEAAANESREQLRKEGVESDPSRVAPLATKAFGGTDTPA